MRARTFKGVTECHFKDFAEVEPKVVELRDRYRAGDKTLDLTLEVSRLFGMNRAFKDREKAVGNATGSESIRLWDEWIGSQPMLHRKLYYDPDVVIECLKGADE